MPLCAGTSASVVRMYQSLNVAAATDDEQENEDKLHSAPVQARTRTVLPILEADESVSVMVSR